MWTIQALKEKKQFKNSPLLDESPELINFNPHLCNKPDEWQKTNLSFTDLILF
jgi:hypothetical protein